MSGSDKDLPPPASAIWTTTEAATLQSQLLYFTEEVSRVGAGQAPAGLPPELTSQAGRYERRGLLGKGGMGTVDLVFDHRLGREVAYKRLDIEETPGTVARFLREARLTCRLEHPGIVRVHDVGRGEDGRLYLTMPVIRGRSLNQWVFEGLRPSDRAIVRRVRDACEALAYAHAKGVVHRDVTPKNLLVGGYGETLVIDWGLSAHLGDVETADTRQQGPQREDLTRFGELLGTPAFMSPEQAKGEPARESMDIWGVGTTLYRLLSGVYPYPNGQALERLREGAAPPPLRTVHPEVCPKLAAVITKTLSIDPRDRYLSAGALAAELTAWLEGQPIAAYSYTLWERTLDGVKAYRVPLMLFSTALTVGLSVLLFNLRSIQRESDKARAAEKRTSATNAGLSLKLALAAFNGGDRHGAETHAADILAHAPEILENDEAAKAFGILSAWGGVPRSVPYRRVELPECERKTVSLNPHIDRLYCLEGERIRVYTLSNGELVDVIPGRWDMAVGLDETRVIVRSLSTREAAIWDGDWRASDAPTITVRDESVPTAQGTFSLTAAGMLSRWGVNNGGFSMLENSPTAHFASIAALSPDGLMGITVEEATTLHGHETDVSGFFVYDMLSPSAPKTFYPVTNIPEFRSICDVAWWPELGLATIATHTQHLLTIDLSSGKVVAELDSHNQPYCDLSAHPSLPWVSGVSQNSAGQGVAYVWDAQTGERHSPLGAGVLSAKFGADGVLWTVTSSEVQQWRLPNRKVWRPLQHWEGIAAMDLSEDGRKLVTALGSGEAVVWDLETFTMDAVLVWQDVPAGVARLAEFGPDGSIMVSGQRQQVGPVLWRPSPDGYVPFQTVKVDQPFLKSAYASSDGRWVGLAWDSAIRVLDRNENTWRREYSTSRFIDWSEAQETDEVFVLDSVGTVYLLNEKRDPLQTLFYNTAAVTLVVSDDGERILLNLGDSLSLVNRKGDLLSYFPMPVREVSAMKILERWDAIALASKAGEIYIIDIKTGRLVADLPGHEYVISDLETDLGETVLYSASWDGTVNRYDLELLWLQREDLVEDLRVAWNPFGPEKMASADTP